ncbi:histidine kinase [Brachybacterium horti]
MDDTSAPPAPGRTRSAPRRARVTPASLASVVIGGMLLLTWFWISLTLLLTGIGSLPALGSGFLLLVPWVLAMRAAVIVERRRAVAVHGLEVIVPARRRSARTGFAGWLHGLWLDVCSGWFWKGVLHHHLAMLVAGVFALLSLVALFVSWVAVDVAVRHGALTLGTVELPRWGLAGIGAAALVVSLLMLVLGALSDRGLARAMISGSEEDLRGQVAELAVRRQGAVDAAAQERLRIERDLHDGVQPRLVALGMTLGMARQSIRTDPDRAEELVTRAHSETKAVITDLRQLARGIHPAVLTDRGLDAALSALAARSAVPVDLQVDLPRPLDREREAVAYFVVAEALTNITKHAGARRASVTLTQTEDSLRVRIEDDGRGGARVHRDGRSTGLAGLTDRVRATGGLLEVASPEGGGTVLLAVVPLPDAIPPRSPATPARVAVPAPEEVTR